MCYATRCYRLKTEAVGKGMSKVLSQRIWAYVSFIKGTSSAGFFLCKVAYSHNFSVIMIVHKSLFR